MIAHPQILVLGYSEAAMLLRSPHRPKISAAVLISGSGEFVVDAPDLPHRLMLRFDDVEALDFTDPANAQRVWARQKWATETGRVLRPPTAEDAQSIIEFARCIADIEGSLLCQCQGGVSRSAAAALLSLATWTPKGDERYCVEQLLRVRPSAVPLLSLVALGDTLLGREGMLMHAIRETRQRERS